MASSSDERKLVTELRAGSRKAFEELLDTYQDKVYGLAYHMVGPAEAEDVAQDALIEVCRSVGGFRGDSSLATWIHRVAANVCLEHRRKRKSVTVELDDDLLDPATDAQTDPSRAAELSEIKGSVDEAISRLSDVHRDVVVLHELQGLTYAECANALGVPVGTVKSRLSNAFVKLRELLKNCAEGEVAI